MEMSKKQTEFFAFLILICTVTAALILLIDFQIKAAILEESNRLRRTIEQNPATAGSYGSAGNGSVNSDYPSDLVHSGTTRMEASGHIQGSNGKSKTRKSRASEPETASDAEGIQDSGE